MLSQKTFLVILFAVSIILSSHALADNLSGVIFGEDSEGIKTELKNATVQWLNSDIGVYTDNKGFFEIKRNSKYHDLVIRYVGYISDTIHAPHDSDYIEVTLKQHLELEGVEVSAQNQSQRIEKSTVTSTQTITTQGLKKAACCNLGESFQTNASVDVSYSDAVSGAKQIMLLGLQGKYTQMMTENIPNLRGAAIKYGLNYVPGSWMDEISISKGTSSVRNGFESITGQINVGFKQPQTSEKLYLNLYANRFGRFEANANSNYILSPNASTMLMVHGNMMQNPIDMNNDNFVDIPVVSQLNIFNRWNFDSENWENKSGIKYLIEDRIGGQNAFVDRSSNDGYGIDINTQRIETFTKNGFILGEHKSIGTILSFSHHDQNSFYGTNAFDIKHNSFYANFLFDTPLFSESHIISTGVSWQYDNYNQFFNQIDNSMEESVPGAFLEYVFTGVDDLTLTGGMRIDNHNNFGTFFTPRLHAKYQISDFTTLRASAGKGFRSPQIFAENTGIMISSREFVVDGNIGMEEAWNYGINFTTDLLIGNTYVTLNADFYRTDFINQVIVDLDQSVDKAVFYNLDGDSYANSMQFELIIEPMQGLTLNTAYRWNDVMQTINGELMQKPLISPHKGFLNVEYETSNESWNFDVTLEFVGSGRLPNTRSNPLVHQRPEFFDPFMLLHSQITKKFDTFEIYLGGENLTDFKQENPIIASDDPFGQFFDSSMIYAPIFGQNIYLGVRYNL